MSPSKPTPTKKYLITLPEQLVADIDDRIGARQRSEWIAAACYERLGQRKPVKRRPPARKAPAGAPPMDRTEVEPVLKAGQRPPA
jgi:hypothetical protein